MTSSSPKPSPPLDVLSRYRSKCDALTILSIMQDKSKKKIQPQSTKKLLIRFHWKCRPLLWQTNFILYTLAFASPPPSPLPPAQCFYVYFDARQMNEKRGSLSILCRKTSRKVAAWKLSVKEFCCVSCDFILPSICFVVSQTLRQMRSTIRLSTERSWNIQLKCYLAYLIPVIW